MEPRNTSSLSSLEDRPLPSLPASNFETSSNSYEHQSPSFTAPQSQFEDFPKDATVTRTEGENGMRESLNTRTTSKPLDKASISTESSGALSQPVVEFMADGSDRASRALPCSGINEAGNQETPSGVERSGRSGPFLSADNTSPCSPVIAQSVAGHTVGGSMRLLSDGNASTAVPGSSRLPHSSVLPQIWNQPGTTESREVIAPRWQSDAEATYCPICKSQFNFFVRKHHCRKCGRVVCNSCSPHRITIPYQYIILPPESVTATSSGPQVHHPPYNSAEVMDHGGGARVRLCNPCVPDPNISTTQPISDSIENHRQNSHNSHSRSASASTPVSYMPVQPHHSREALGLSSANNTYHPRRPNNLTNRSRNSRSSNPSYGASYSWREERGLRPENLGGQSRSNTKKPICNQLTLMTSSQGNFSNPSSGDPLHQNARSMSHLGHKKRPLPQARRALPRQISEDDECWICHEELPSKSLENYEALRAAHVSSCVSFAIGSTSGVRRDTSTVSAPEQIVQSELESGNIPGSTRSPLNFRNSSQHGGQIRDPYLAPRKHIGVFSYRATKKDSIDDAECTICLEEFEAGQDMGRLECFCRFHLKCIREWFEMRPGQCPVHQHDSGY